jgi:RHS repeat-associated protein
VGGASGFSSALVKRLLLPNTSAITNYFDNVGRLLGTYLRTSAGVLTNKHEYLYDPANQRTNETRMDASSLAYTYDNIGQLKVADSSVAAEDRGYTYDAAWNLNYRTNNGVLGTFGVNVKNELTNNGSYTFSYDFNGNMLTNGPIYAALTYDDENRLTIISSDIYKLFRSTFAYDGIGRLRKRIDYEWQIPAPGPGAPPPPSGQGSWVATNTVLYIYDGMRVIQERNTNNVPTVTYTRGNDLSGSLEGAGGIGGLLARSHGYNAGTGAWSTHNYYHADGNGNITFMLDTNQTMVATYRYDPFGNLINKSGSLADANVYRFSSKEVHLGSGLYYYLYRFYDPNLQRWINRDPLGELGFRTLAEKLMQSSEEPNTYAFLRNNGISEIDPEGLAKRRHWEWEQTQTVSVPGMPPPGFNGRCLWSCQVIVKSTRLTPKNFLDLARCLNAAIEKMKQAARAGNESKFTEGCAGMAKCFSSQYND